MLKFDSQLSGSAQLNFANILQKNPSCGYTKRLDRSNTKEYKWSWSWRFTQYLKVLKVSIIADNISILSDWNGDMIRPIIRSFSKKRDYF